MFRQFDNKTYNRKFCERYLHGFSSQNVLLEHMKLCGQHDAVSIKKPSSNSYISFRHFYKTSLCPYTIYADIEALFIKKLTCKAKPSAAGTTKLEDQIPCSFGPLLVDKPNNKTVYKFDRSSNEMQIFFIGFVIKLKSKNQTTCDFR